MISLPLLVVWVSSQVLYFRLSTVAALALSLLLSFVCAAVAAQIWERRSKRTETSFSELMIWSWYRLHKAERRIEQGLIEARTASSREEQLQVLQELSAALESKDPYTRGHSRRVERHSFKTGVAMGLPPADVEILRMSASLHDVGKIRVPNKVLHKPGKLSQEERALIEEHPALGAEMVSSIGDERIVDAIRHHHERWDGRGYPDGIGGTDIPLFARVIAVADSYDAIRSTRSYRAGASRDESVSILVAESGHQFDEEVVDAFLTTLPARGRVVAWLTSLATAPGAMWRFLEQLFQRFGSTALAPAIGAAGTAVIIGTTSLLSPAIPALGYAIDRSPAPVPSPATSSSTGLREVGRPTRGDRVADQTRAERRREARREQRADTTVGGSGSSGASQPTDQKQPAASGTTTSTDTGRGDEATTGDPTGEGKDCKERPGRPSKGERLHCG